MPSFTPSWESSVWLQVSAAPRRIRQHFHPQAEKNGGQEEAVGGVPPLETLSDSGAILPPGKPNWGEWAHKPPNAVDPVHHHRVALHALLPGKVVNAAAHLTRDQLSVTLQAQPNQSIFINFRVLVRLSAR